MPNTLLTPQIIAREALMQLRNNCVMARLVHRNYSNEFVGAKGDTISVRKPATFRAEEFTGKINVQDAKEEKISVKMDHHLDTSFAVTSKDMTLTIADFSQQFLIPAMQSFANTIDSSLLGLCKDIPYFAGKGGTLPTKADTIIDAGKVLNQNKAPMGDRHLVLDPETEAAFMKIDAFHSADKVGDNGTAMREASLGRKFGFDTYMDQNVPTLAGGALTGTAKPSGAFEPGMSTITLTASSLTGNVKAGDMLKIDGEAYAITADASASGNNITVNITPALRKKITASSKVEYAAGKGIQNLAFHRNALALVTRPLALPKGAVNAAIVNYDGFGIRVVYGYDMTTKTDVVSLDLLYGVKTLNPDLAVRVLA